MQEVVYFIEGDGIGSEIWAVTKNIVNATLKKVYGEEFSIRWHELVAGEKALKETGELLPAATLLALSDTRYAIKGPLGTPVGTGFRSVNVALRQGLDLYACIRPVRYFKGVNAPVKHPEKVDMIIFRENTEDLYLGIEYQSNTPEAKKLIDFLREELHVNIDPTAGVGIKPMTEKGSKRLVRRAIQHAFLTGRDSVTLMHKGNIMKYTEGAFRQWGYEVAEESFGDLMCIESEPENNKLMIKDRIADALFQEVLLYPEQYSVIATSNLNGDYLSDALAAQVGGLGMAPGVNKSDTLSLYEATHGTAPALAGKDRANPCSLLLSAAMMLEEMDKREAAKRIVTAVENVIAEKTVTGDIAVGLEGAKVVGCKEFGDLVGASL